jgi:type I restriction enzyme S subunit
MARASAASAWFASPPRGWEYSRIKYEVARIGSGGTPNTDDDALWARDGSGVAWVSIADMSTTDVVTYTERRLTAAGVASKNLETFPPGTLLYSMYASVGKISVLAIPAAINQAIVAILPDANKADARFFRWALQYVSQRILEVASTNTQDNLNLQKVRNAFLLRPPMDEQIAIAEFLDRETAETDALVSKYERLIELLGEKRAARITQAVTKGLDADVTIQDSGIKWIGTVPAHWSLTPLKHVVDGLTVGIVVTPAAYYVDEGVPCLRSFNLGERLISSDGLAYISEASNALHRKSQIREGDIVIVRTGRPGTAAVVDSRFHNANCVDLIIARRSVRVLPDFLAYYLNSEAARVQCELASGGALQQHFNVGVAGSLLVCLPPLDEQARIVDYLDTQCEKFTRLIGAAHEALALITEHRSALITAAVTGEIDVPNYRSKHRPVEVSAQ